MLQTFQSLTLLLKLHHTLQNAINGGFICDTCLIQQMFNTIGWTSLHLAKADKILKMQLSSVELRKPNSQPKTKQIKNFVLERMQILNVLRMIS